MPFLHIVNKSPTEAVALDSCLRLIKRGSGILLIENGVYAAQKNQECTERLADALVENSLYALEPDLGARGLGFDRLIDEVILVDYAGFVQLSCEYDNTVSWF